MENNDTNRQPEKHFCESSNDDLERRLMSEVSTAESRISKMRSQAITTARKRIVDLRTFVVAANQIDSLIQSKINALTTSNVLEVITRTECLVADGLPDGLFAGKKITFTVPRSIDCPAKVEVTFDISHDSTIENVIVSYKLQIIPVFFQFDNSDQTIAPFAEPNKKQTIQWMDDRIVDFTKALFQIRFHAQYQKNHIARDPVLNIQFPKTFAVGSTEQDGRVAHFFTKESMLEFEDGPLSFLTSFIGIDPNANHCI